MEITYDCGAGAMKTTRVPGDAWKHPAALLVCKSPKFVPPPLRPDASGRLRGFVDLHTNPLANLAFGGKLIYGDVDVGSLLPADPNCHHNVHASSQAQALGHDKSTHGGHDFFSNPCGDDIRQKVIHGLQKALKGADEPSC